MKNEGIKKAIVIVSPAFFVCAMVVCFCFFSSGSSMFVEKFKSVKIFNIVNAKNIVDVQVDSDNENKIIVSPFDAKLIKERELNEKAARHIEVYSDEKRYLILVSKGLDLPVDMLVRVKSGNTTFDDEKLIQLLLAGGETEEENFRMEMKDKNSFSDLLKAVDDRQKATGIFYGDALLEEGVTYRDATSDEIISVLESGAQLPVNALQIMASMKNIDLAVELYNKGINLNSSYIDPLSSLTPIETLVELYSIAPYDSQKLVDDVKKLIDIGVPLKVNDGTRDALDIVLNGILVHDEKTSEQLMNVAIELNNLGVVAEASHQELLERLKQKYPDIYDAQGSKLR